MERHASLFRNGCDQAVRIPREFELAWMLDTNTLSDLIRHPRGPLVERLGAPA